MFSTSGQSTSELLPQAIAGPGTGGAERMWSFLMQNADMSTTVSSGVYQPGVCNIGPAEIRKRRAGGYLGLVVTILALIAFVVFQVPTPWRILIALPAGLAANGFLQAAFHFCVGFGTRGLFNMQESLGHEETVSDAEFRKADQKKAYKILGISTAISLGVVIIAILLP
jgi:hypothetical protein